MPQTWLTSSDKPDSRIRFDKVGLLIALLSFVLYSCSSNQPDISNELQKSFVEIVAFNDMNSSLRVKVIPSDTKGYQFGSDVNIVVENMSEQQIILPGDESITRIFIVRNDQWIEIKDKYNTYGVGGVLGPKGQLDNVWITMVRPVLGQDIKSESGQDIIRIVVIGELLVGDKSSRLPVGAYVDLFIKQ